MVGTKVRILNTCRVLGVRLPPPPPPTSQAHAWIQLPFCLLFIKSHCVSRSDSPHPPQKTKCLTGGKIVVWILHVSDLWIFEFSNSSPPPPTDPWSTPGHSTSFCLLWKSNHLTFVPKGLNACSLLFGCVFDFWVKSHSGPMSWSTSGQSTQFFWAVYQLWRNHDALLVRVE